MKVAILQPAYLPWLGYFDLMDQVDAFVLLDSVQFEKRSWQQRNRIKTASGLQWLTVPVAVKGKFEQAIREVRISETRFAAKHLGTVQSNYARASYLSDYSSVLSDVLSRCFEGMRLVDLNVQLLHFFRATLGINTPMLLASSLVPEGNRTHRLADICKKLGATEYISPLGSAVYLLSELDILEAFKVQTFFHHYEHPQYKQLFPPFLPFASTIDLILNEGDRAMAIIRSGRRVLLKPEEVASGNRQAKPA